MSDKVEDLAEWASLPAGRVAHPSASLSPRTRVPHPERSEGWEALTQPATNTSSRVR